MTMSWLRALVWLALAAVQVLASQARAGQLPPHNPYYSDAPASTMHGGAVYGRLSPVPGPRDVKRPLKPDELIWQPTQLIAWTLHNNRRRSSRPGAKASELKLGAFRFPAALAGEVGEPITARGPAVDPLPAAG